MAKDKLMDVTVTCYTEFSVRTLHVGISALCLNNDNYKDQLLL